MPEKKQAFIPSPCCGNRIKVVRNQQGNLIEYFFCNHCKKHLDKNTLEFLKPVRLHKD